MWDKLEEMKKKYLCIVDHRGIGLIQGLEFASDPKQIVNKAISKGLILIAAGNNTIRFVPPLIISKENVDEMILLLSDIIQ